MPKLDDARTRILDAAQALAQTKGYSGLSFRDIGAEIGIKSASIHYHFPTKDDLVVALIERYRVDFFSSLNADCKPETSARARLDAFIEASRTVLTEQKRMCLCGMMAAEAELLSSRARAAAQAFFTASIDWLVPVFKELGRADAKAAATDAVARLEGAMLLARLANDPVAFDQVADRLTALAE